jgi:threonine/homoserine/homoserine lactone efflux protein
MSLPLFFKGLALGLAIAAPVGPIGILCIRRTLAEGWALGLAVGLGAATADAVYGAIAGFGLTAVSGFLVNQSRWLGLLGGLFLLYLGVRTFRSVPAERPANLDRSGWWPAFGATAFLTLTNPLTILSFVAVFAGFGLAEAGATRDYWGAVMLVVGVFLGSALWWLILSSGVAWFRNRLTPSALRRINQLSGLIILGFGISALISGLR